MPASSELEYWNGSAWVKESNLISLSIKDKLQEPLVLEAMIGNFSDTELNTRESNYGKFLKVRVKEKYSEKKSIPNKNFRIRVMVLFLRDRVSRREDVSESLSDCDCPG